jgi:hypothetical protein
LPEFNPWIPDTIADRFSALHPLACDCVRRTQAGEKFHSLYWLKFYNRLLKAIIRAKIAEAGSSPTAQLSKQESSALRWAYHKGKWNWDNAKDQRHSKSKPTKSRRDNKCEEPEKRKPQPRKVRKARKGMDQRAVPEQ